MHNPEAPHLQRRRARKTAVVLALVALCVYGIFVLQHLV